MRVMIKLVSGLGCLVALSVFGAVPASADKTLPAPSGVKGERVSERSAFSRTWETDSGKRVTRFSTGPVNWRDGDGRWRAFDLDLSRSADGTPVGEVGDAQLRLPARLGSGEGFSLRTSDAGRVELRLERARAATPSLSGASATYEGGVDGGDVRLTATPEGVKEELVLRDRDAAPRSFTYRLSVPDGVVPELSRGGAINLSLDDRVVLQIPAGVVKDSSAGSIARPTGRYELERLGAGTWRISMSLPAAWADSPKRRWPLIVDPGLVRTDVVDANRQCLLIDHSSPRFDRNQPRCGTPWPETNYIGWMPGDEDGLYRDALYFDLSTRLPTSSVVTAAALHVRVQSSEIAPWGGPQIGVYRMTQQ